MNFKRSLSGSGSAGYSPPSEKGSQRLTKNPSSQVKLPASFCGIQVQELNSSDIGTKISGGTTTQNGGLPNNLNHENNSKENSYVEMPQKNAPQRLESIKMKTFTTVVEVNGNNKETINLDTVTNNVFSSES